MDSGRYSFSQRVATVWNSLPDSLRRVMTVLEFKSEYDEWTSGRRLGA